MSSSSDSAPGEEPALGSSDSGRSTTGDQTQDIGSAVDRARAVVTECTRHQADGEFLLYRKTFVAASDPSTDKDADTAQPATQSAWARAKEHLRAEWASHRHSDPMLLVETESADEGREHHKKDGTIDGIVIQLADPRIASAFIVHGWTHTTKSKPRDRAATKGAKVLADALAHAWGVNPNFIHYAGRLGSKGERDMIGAIFIADRANPADKNDPGSTTGFKQPSTKGMPLSAWVNNIDKVLHPTHLSRTLALPAGVHDSAAASNYSTGPHGYTAQLRFWICPVCLRLCWSYLRPDDARTPPGPLPHCAGPVCALTRAATAAPATFHAAVCLDSAGKQSNISAPFVNIILADGTDDNDKKHDGDSTPRAHGAHFPSDRPGEGDNWLITEFVQLQPVADDQIHAVTDRRARERQAIARPGRVLVGAAYDRARKAYGLYRPQEKIDDKTFMTVQSTRVSPAGNFLSGTGQLPTINHSLASRYGFVCAPESQPEGEGWWVFNIGETAQVAEQEKQAAIERAGLAPNGDLVQLRPVAAPPRAKSKARTNAKKALRADEGEFNPEFKLPEFGVAVPQSSIVRATLHKHGTPDDFQFRFRGPSETDSVVTESESSTDTTTDDTQSETESNTETE